MVRLSPPERVSDILEPNTGRSTSSPILTWPRSPDSTGRSGISAGGALNDEQNQAILLASLICACISLVVVLVTLRWFLIMRRSFRHRLVLYLIISDTFKAVWYFIFPTVVFVKGPVNSGSNFCQVSGFMLVLAIESSDMAILIIALHSILYILNPGSTLGEGGLYRYRRWTYIMWLGPALLAASLAFLHDKDPYITAGTFCYLPKRPIGYRLALSWVPRYLIIGVILIMYIWIYIYVHIKFRGFDNLGATNSSHYNSGLRNRSDLSTRCTDPERRAIDQSPALPSQAFMLQTQNPFLGGAVAPEERQPWDDVKFITSKPLQSIPTEAPREIEGRSMLARGSEWSGETQIPPDHTLGPLSSIPELQDNSALPRSLSATKDQIMGTSVVCPVTPSTTSTGLNDPLKRTRLAIRKQLRYLFIYPLVYILMWSFPFASHALNYNNYYVAHPIFWLSLVQTVMLSLQAGVDSVLFSWTEKPWRRIDPNSKFSMPFLRRRSKELLQRRGRGHQAPPSADEGTMRQPSAGQHQHWWEAEGRRRNDSVWLGTNRLSDFFSPITTRARSRSPDKTRRSMHSRTRSSEQGTTFVPRLQTMFPAKLRIPTRQTLSPVAMEGLLEVLELTYKAEQRLNEQESPTSPTSPTQA
ncbi:uncharacterized protein Z520_01896 [Fonsecaea multimorphosa CBS 102226]|uniref:G-protein coupled receptors family 1 profile domain-containing protein n=1 Tax=Fonsecaea multimorphosa CBS 102226 TaxID=1442371 RepID=A0A0D2K743_9EURO|nr:uncharacterized protein Z520_01896 [Fonsecaea multimorphosa CBS 102226]KIY01758.1 hypothetical protein Z520_01896 [Fonsecaea multimorphosa CBS 102226]OAL29952.1 hypothetical protein AYO22_01858 [Fonsecaea multimorphosa]